MPLRQVVFEFFTSGTSDARAVRASRGDRAGHADADADRRGSVTSDACVARDVEDERARLLDEVRVAEVRAVGMRRRASTSGSCAAEPDDDRLGLRPPEVDTDA